MAESEMVEDGSLLGRFGGARPPAAPWFDAVLAIEPERSTFEVDGAAIELLTWGEVGKPGLLFLHGNAAHADWWSMIAPFFAADFRCAAISWSGMGRSDWRERYAIPTFAREALTAIAVAGLAASGEPPVIVAHSFGGFPTLYICAEHPEAIAGAMLVDSSPPKQGGGPPPRLAQGRTCVWGRLSFSPRHSPRLPAPACRAPGTAGRAVDNYARRSVVREAGTHFAIRTSCLQRSAPKRNEPISL